MFKLLQLLIISATVLIFTATTPARAAANSIVITDEVQLGLADSFMADNEYYRAVTEYMKFLYLFPDSERTPYALLQIGMANYQGGEHRQAIEYFARVRATYSSEYFPTAAFYEGVCYEKLKQPDKARDAFDRAFFFDPSTDPAATALIGRSLNRAGQSDTAASRASLQKHLELFPDSERFEGATRSLILLDEFETAPRKSPAMAGTMSAILPGSGHMYAGRYKDGMMSLLINGLFIAGTVAAIDDENYAVAAIVGGVGLPFYLGNIYGAANAANKWNVSLRKDLQHNMAISLDYRY
jgi:tetratricopeptide (TPR) repeat protein